MGISIKSHKEFEIFYKKLYPAVYAFMKNYVQNKELAEDLTQEAFIRVYEKKDEIESVEYAKAFLYTIARNLYLNHVRHIKIETDYYAQLLHTEINDSSFFKEVIRQETIRIIYQSINTLSPKVREIILLNLEGKNNQEIAEKLGISVNTVKFLKKSAYEKLRKILSKENLFLLFLFLKN